MTEIQLNQTVKIKGQEVDSLVVEPLTFVHLTSIWNRTVLRAGKKKPETLFQRERIKFQAHFMRGDERLMPEDSDISSLPIKVGKSIIFALDEGQGERGEVLNDGDGITKAILYKLGTPILMKSGKGEELAIKELEFFAEVYGDVEDILSADNEMNGALELITRLGKPVGVESLTSLPGWAIDRFTVADGVTIMRDVLPNF